MQRKTDNASISGVVEVHRRNVLQYARGPLSALSEEPRLFTAEQTAFFYVVGSTSNNNKNTPHTHTHETNSVLSTGGASAPPEKKNNRPGYKQGL